MNHSICALIIAVSLVQGGDLTRRLPEANITLDLPNDSWALANKEDNNGMTVYIYKRQPVRDSEGRQIVPNIAVIIEDVESDLDVVSYSIQKRTKVGFQVQEVFNHEDGKLRFTNAIAYKGNYTDKGGLEHTIYVVHGINGSKGFQMICDTTTGVLEKLEDEFQKTLLSLRK